MKRRQGILIGIVIITFILFEITIAAAYDPTVFQVQERLKHLGFDPGMCDGIWGTKTQRALNQFQEANALPVTEKLDDKTNRKLGYKEINGWLEIRIHGTLSVGDQGTSSKWEGRSCIFHCSDGQLYIVGFVEGCKILPIKDKFSGGVNLYSGEEGKYLMKGFIWDITPSDNNQFLSGISGLFKAIYSERILDSK